MAVGEKSAGIALATTPTRPSRWQRIKVRLQILVRSKTALVGLFPIVFWVVVALLADDCIIQPACWVRSEDYTPTPWLARYSPYKQITGRELEGPSADHWLGTDRHGRDLWARLAYGSRTILTLAPLSVGVALLVGGTLGLMAGYYGAWE